MRTIITAVFLIAMLSPSLGIAQVYYNQLGLYSDLSADVSATSIDMPASGFLHLYLIVTNPLNEDFIWRDIDGHLIGPYPREMTTISGFECKIILPPGYSLASFSLPVQNYGLESAGPENFKVSFYDPTPVPANKTVLLLSLTYIVESVGPNFIYLAPVTENGPSIPGETSILDGAGGLLGDRHQACHPVSGNYANPVFGIDSLVVSNETRTFGGVKALYR